MKIGQKYFGAKGGGVSVYKDLYHVITLKWVFLSALENFKFKAILVALDLGLYLNTN